jgi:hypothetical protein
MDHRNIPKEGNHGGIAFHYADAAARTGATGLTAADVDKLARQLDDNSCWILVDHTGPTWASVGGGVTDHGALTGLSDPDHPPEAINLPQGAGVTTFTTGKQWFNCFSSGGAVSGFALTDNGDGTIDIANGEILIRDGGSALSDIAVYQVAAVSSLALLDGYANYIYIDYNAGTPQTVASPVPPNFRDEVPIHLVFRNGTTVHAISSQQLNRDYVGLRFIRDIYLTAFERASFGGELTEAGTRNVALGTQRFFFGNEELQSSTYNTSAADTFTAIYKDGGGGWTRTTGQSQVPNGVYDDASGTPAALTTDYFGVFWVYLVLGTNETLCVLYGQDEYKTLAEAQAAPLPSSSNRAPELRDGATGVLIGKIVVQEGETNFIDIMQPAGKMHLDSTTGVVDPGAGGFQAVRLTQDVSSGNNGGTSSAASWNLRQLATLENYGSYSWVSFDNINDRFTLDAGLYSISVTAQVFAVGGHQLRLREDPAGTPSTKLVGESQHCPYFNEEASQTGVLKGVFSIASSTVFQIEHYTELSVATYGLGKPVGSGEEEVYCTVEIARLGD